MSSLFTNIECSNLAYEKLQLLGIEQKAKLVERDLTKIFLYRTIWEGKANKILEDAKKSKKSRVELNEEQKDILSLEAKLEKDDFFIQIDPYVIRYPFLVAKVVLGEELENYSKYGFSSKKNLASAVTAYCIGEKDAINDNKNVYTWRQGEYKNKIYLCQHGDLLVDQTDVSKVEESGALINPPKEGFGRRQDWSPFLISILKYAKAIGKNDIAEIKNWQELIRPLREHNIWGSNYSDFTDSTLFLDMQYEMDLSGAENKHLILGITDSVLPYYNNSFLEFLREDKQGDFEIMLYNHPKRFTRLVHYIPEDIPHLIKANYQLYARSVEDLAKIMYWFNKEFNNITV